MDHELPEAARLSSRSQTLYREHLRHTREFLVRPRIIGSAIPAALLPAAFQVGITYTFPANPLRGVRPLSGLGRRAFAGSFPLFLEIY